MRKLILSTFLYACESWTLTAEIERRIQALEMRCYRRLMNISYKNHVTNEEARNRIQNAIGVHDDLLTMVKKRNSDGMSTSQDPLAWRRQLCRGQWKEQEGEKDRRRDEKITSKNGQEWSLEIPWGQRKTGKDGKVLLQRPVDLRGQGTEMRWDEGQGHLLAFVQGHSDSAFSNCFSSKNTRPFEAKFHMEPPWDVGMKICSKILGHMTKMASRPMYGKNLQKSHSSKPSRRWPWNLVYSNGYSSTTKFIQRMTLGWPWPVLWHGQICCLILLHGWKLIQHIVMYFQAWSYSAYPMHSGERYRTSGPLVWNIIIVLLLLFTNPKLKNVGKLQKEFIIEVKE